MSEGIVNNNPKKELLFALGGIAMFLGIVLLIGVSAFLRPAGEHITAETTEASAAADEAEATATEEEAAPAVICSPAGRKNAETPISKTIPKNMAMPPKANNSSFFGLLLTIPSDIPYPPCTKYLKY
jgi:hypothetical protein